MFEGVVWLWSFSSPFWTSLAWFVAASIQIGDSFEEVAVLVILTDTSPFECFFIRLKAQIRIIIEIAAAPVPMRGHFSVSVSEVADGLMGFPEWMSVLTKVVLLMFIFLLQIFAPLLAFCSETGNFPLFGLTGV